MSKRKYVENFVEKASTNIRKYLRGHGLRKDMINVIAERPDIVAKLGVLLYNSVNRSKYVTGLGYKKGVISMVGYKNYGKFNVNCRQDIEEFIETMSENDQNEFTNNSNIMIIACKPDADVCQDPNEQVKTGPSEIITFNQAVRADQRALGAQFIIMVMFAPSFVATPEAKKEPRKIVRISADEQRRRMELKRKKKVAAIRADIRNNKSAISDLMSRKRQLTNQMGSSARQIQRLKKIFGQNIGQEIENMNNQRLMYDEQIVSALRHASENDKTLAKAIIAARKRGADAASLKRLTVSFDNKALAAMILAKVPTTGDEKMTRLAAKKRAQLKKLNDELIPLAMKVKAWKSVGYKGSEYRSAYNRMKLLERKASALKAELEVYSKKDGLNTITRKTDMLKKVNERINKYLAKGEELDTALAKALVAEGATPDESEIITTQVAQQIAEGIPGQHAVMQAIQDNIEDDNASIFGDY